MTCLPMRDSGPGRRAGEVSETMGPRTGGKAMVGCGQGEGERMGGKCDMRDKMKNAWQDGKGRYFPYKTFLTAWDIRSRRNIASLLD